MDDDQPDIIAEMKQEIVRLKQELEDKKNEDKRDSENDD
jgi:hypothetical protein